MDLDQSSALGIHGSPQEGTISHLTYSSITIITSILGNDLLLSAVSRQPSIEPAIGASTRRSSQEGITNEYRSSIAYYLHTFQDLNSKLCMMNSSPKDVNQKREKGQKIAFVVVHFFVVS